MSVKAVEVEVDVSSEMIGAVVEDLATAIWDAAEAVAEDKGIFFEDTVAEHILQRVIQFLTSRNPNIHQLTDLHVEAHENGSS